MNYNMVSCGQESRPVNPIRIDLPFDQAPWSVTSPTPGTSMLQKHSILRGRCPSSTQGAPKEDRASAPEHEGYPVQ